MNSFYGGKQGRTYHIVERYDCIFLDENDYEARQSGRTYNRGEFFKSEGQVYLVISENFLPQDNINDEDKIYQLRGMVNCFQNGGAYTDVNYGQYVIIDTVLIKGRSNSENGLLYRRGFDWNQRKAEYPKKENNQTDQEFLSRWVEFIQHPGAGAIYVGQIVGPEGRSAEIEIEQWSDFIDQRQNDEDSRGVFGKKTSVIVNNYSAGKMNDGQGNITFDDQIQVGYINIRDPQGDIQGAYIAMNIPKLVMEAEIINHSPYSITKVEQSNQSKLHPFYYKWLFTIPDGKHGQDITNIIKEKGSVLIAAGETVDSQGNALQENDDYITYTTTNYDSSTPEISEHLGRWPYRIINTVTTNNASRSIITSWDSTTRVSKGTLYRNENYPQDVYISCIKGGLIPIDFPFNENLFYLGQKLGSYNTSLWQVINIPSETPPYGFTFDYTAGPSDDFNNFRNLDHLFVDNQGDLYAFYSDSIDTPHYLTNTSGILSIDFNVGYPQRTVNREEWERYSDGSIKFFDINGDPTIEENNILKIRYKDGRIDGNFQIKRIKSISLNNDYTVQQNFKVQYKDDSIESVSEPINTVLAFERFNTDNIYILYSDPNVRNNLPSNRIRIQDWTDPVNNVVYTGMKWYNLGPLGAQYHVQGVYTLENLKRELRRGFDYVQGLEDRAGWVVTVLIEEELNGITLEVPHLFAFDYNAFYNNNEKYILPDQQQTPTYWYEIMQLSAAVIDPKRTIAISDDEEHPTPGKNYTNPQDLITNGIWFVVSNGHDDRY